MKRLFWLGVGLAVGAVVVRMVTKRASSYTPRGIAGAVRDSGRNAFDSVRDFVDDVRDGMDEREEELHAALLEARSSGGGPGGVGGEFEDEFEGTLDELDAAFAGRAEGSGQPASRPERYPTEDTTR